MPHLDRVPNIGALVAGQAGENQGEGFKIAVRCLPFAKEYLADGDDGRGIKPSAQLCPDSPVTAQSAAYSLLKDRREMLSILIVCSVADLFARIDVPVFYFSHPAGPNGKE